MKACSVPSARPRHDAETGEGRLPANSTATCPPSSPAARVALDGKDTPSAVVPRQTSVMVTAQFGALEWGTTTFRQGLSRWIESLKGS